MGVLSYLKRLFGKKFSKSVEPVVHSEEIVKFVELSNEKESTSEITTHHEKQLETIEVPEELITGSLTKTKVKLSDKETENKEIENTKPSKKSTSKKKK
jgi:hypothetical protein